MADTPHGEPVRIIGEERLHPALHKLGRACIALVRWQRQQQQTATGPGTAEDTSVPGPGNRPAPQAEAPAIPEQEHPHD